MSLPSSLPRSSEECSCSDHHRSICLRRFSSRTAADFTEAPAALVEQLRAAGRRSFSPVQMTGTPIETVFCAPSGVSGTCGNASVAGWLRFDIAAAALDTTNDRTVNYDMLVFFDVGAGILPGPFAKPSTGPAYVRAGHRSGLFFFEGSGNKVERRSS